MGFLDKIADKSSINRFKNLLEMRKGKYKLDTMPFDVQLEVTTRCNLACIMCTRHRYFGKGSDIDLSILEKVEQEVLPYTQRLVASSFGEPLLYPHIEKVLEWKKKFPKLELGFFTNGILLTPEISDKIVEYKVDFINLSMESVTKENYEKIRRGAKWETLVKNLTYLRDLKRKKNVKYPHIHIAGITLSQNIYEIPQFIDFAKEFDINLVVFKHNIHLEDENLMYLSIADMKEEANNIYLEAFKKARSIGLNTNFDKRPFEIPSTKQIPVLERFSEYFKNRLYHITTRFDFGIPKLWYAAGKSPVFLIPTALVKIYDKYLRRYPKDRNTPIYSVNLEPPSRCGNPWTHIHIRYDGSIIPCCFDYTEIGNLMYQSVEEIWNSKKYQSLRKSIITGKFWSTCLASGCTGNTKGIYDSYGAEFLNLPKEIRFTLLSPQTLNIKVRNTGRFVWYNKNDDESNSKAVTIAYKILNENSEVIQEGQHTPFLNNVEPDEIGSAKFTIIPLYRAGNFRIQFDLVHEDLVWFDQRCRSAISIPFINDIGCSLEIEPQMEFIELSKDSIPDEITFPVRVKNIGTSDWIPKEPENTFLSYHIMNTQRKIELQDGVRTQLGLTILRSGEEVQLKAKIKMPKFPKKFFICFDLLEENKHWYSLDRVTQPIEVFLK